MPHLLLLRHAKSGWAKPGMTDFDRPLDETGRAEAQMLANHMRAKGYANAAVFCSPALRTRQTIDIALGGKSDVTFVDRLYSADAQFYLDTARNAGSVEAALLVGHNPMTEELARALAQRGQPDSMHALRSGYPTCGLAVFRFEGPFSSLDAENTYLEDFTTPAAV